MRNSLLLLCFFSFTYASAFAQSGTDSLILDQVSIEAKKIESLRSLLIQQQGVLISEDYFNGRKASQPYNIKSASKSIMTLLIGIAIDKGFITNIDEPIQTYFREYFTENPNPKKEQITIRNLLSMQSGLETTSSRNYGKWVISKNWVEYQLNQPFVEEIGGTMVYSTGISHLLSVILTKATGMNTKAFADRYLFDPMDIRIGGWDRDPQGYYLGGNNLSMKPRDMVKIGQLMLDLGEYQGRQLVSKQWILDSLQEYTQSNYNPYGYGYMWWMQELSGYQLYFAWGNGGQYIFMIPELDAVVVMMSSSYNTNPSRRYKRPVFQLLEDQVIPFLELNL